MAFFFFSDLISRDVEMGGKVPWPLHSLLKPQHPEFSLRALLHWAGIAL